MRKLEILIVVAVLFLIALAVGCKDKAEATLWSIDRPEVEYIDCAKHGKSEYMRYHDGFRESYYCKRCYGEFLNKNLTEIIRDIDLSEPNERTDVKFTSFDKEVIIDIIDGNLFCNKSPEETIKIIYNTVSSFMGAICLEVNLPVRFPEPNEPLLKIETDATDSWLEAVERWPDAQGYITDNFGRTTPISTFTKPNEPKCKHEIITGVEILSYICSCGKVFNTWEILMNNIPTWPDYIELEKELIIIWPDDKLDLGGVQLNYQPKVTMCKGTKIYFKE